MRKVEVKCSCGGTTTIAVQARQFTALAECACGNLLTWAGEAPVAPEAPAILGISVSDSVKIEERLH